MISPCLALGQRIFYPYFQYVLDNPSPTQQKGKRKPIKFSTCTRSQLNADIFDTPVEVAGETSFWLYHVIMPGSKLWSNDIPQEAGPTYI